MKIALLGNMNNNFYNLCKLLRRRGYNVELLPFKNEYRFFQPKYDTFKEIDNSFIKKTNIDYFRSYFIKSQKRIFENYDFFICCGIGPALLRKYNLKCHMFLPYGGDLITIPFPDYYRNISSLRPHSRFLHYILGRAQKKAIKECKIISSLPSGLYTPSINALQVENKTIPLSFPYLDLEEWSPKSVKNYIDYLTVKKQVKDFVGKFETTIFSAARHVWKIEGFADNKGNDKLIKAIHNLKKNKIEVGLILVEKGCDLQYSKKLVIELNLQNNILWLPELPRREIYLIHSLCDIAADQFITGGIGGCGMEALALGKPLLVNIGCNKDTYCDIMWRSFPPVMDVYSTDDIKNALLDYLNRPNYYMKLGKLGRRWVEFFYGERLVNKISYLIESIHNNKNIDILKLKFDLSEWENLNKE